MNYSVEEIAQIVQGEIIGNPDQKVGKHFFDSRNILQSENGAFWAFKGKVDGSQFILEAYQKGIRVFFSETEVKVPDDASLVIVENTKDAFQELSKIHLTNNELQTVGITGSNGKTIVKEWLFQCLFEEENIVRSPKSYNSQIGLPLSLLNVENEHSLGIFEVGISEKNEMEKLQNIFQPTYGVFTNIGESHLENFNSKTDLIKEKLILFKDTKNLAYNVEIEPFIDKNKFEKLISFGGSNSDVFTKEITPIEAFQYRLNLSVNGKDFNIVVPFSDKASIENIECLVATLVLMGYSLDFIQEKIQNISSIEMRLELIPAQGNAILIRDEFSLDYPSLEIALNVLNQQVKENKIVILSDFDKIEVGKEKLYSVIDLLNAHPINEIYFIGSQFKPYNQKFKAKISFYDSTEELESVLKLDTFSDSAILIKGARKYGLETV